jgi:hypothetical protein
MNKKMNKKKILVLLFLTSILLANNYNFTNNSLTTTDNDNLEDYNNNILRQSIEPQSINLTLLEDSSFINELNLSLDEDYDYFSDIKVNVSSIEYKTKFEDKLDIVGVNTSIINGINIANQSDISHFKDNDLSTDGVWVEAGGSLEDEVELDVKISIELKNDKMNEAGELEYFDYYELIYHYLNLTLETIQPPTPSDVNGWEVCIGADCYWNVSLMYQNYTSSEELILNSIHKSDFINSTEILTQTPINLTSIGDDAGIWNYNNISFTHPSQIPIENFTQYSINNGFNNQSGTWTGNPIFTFRIWTKSVGSVSKWADMICQSKIKINELEAKHQFKWNETSEENYNSEWDFYIQTYYENNWINNSINESGFEHLFDGSHQYLTPYHFILLKTDIYDTYESMNITFHYLNITLYKYPPNNFSLSSNGNTETPNSRDGNYVLNWTNSLFAHNYSLYESNKTITEINYTVSLIAEGLTNNSYLFHNRSDGVYYHLIYAINDVGNTSSICLQITVGKFPLSFIVNITETERGTIYLNWSESIYADNYTVLYAYENGNGLQQYMGIEGTYKTNFTLSNLIEGLYFFGIFANNKYGSCIQVVGIGIVGIYIPPVDDDDQLTEFNWVLLIILLSVIGIGIGVGIYIYLVRTGRIRGRKKGWLEFSKIHF